MPNPVDSKVNALVIKAEGKKVAHQVKRIPFQNDPELNRMLGTLGGYRGSRQFMHDMHTEFRGGK